MSFLKEIKTPNHQTQNFKKYISLMAITGVEKNPYLLYEFTEMYYNLIYQ